jgi:hypothetical protein
MPSVANKPFTLNVVMLNVVMLNVVMLNVVLLNVVMLSVIMLIVEAPERDRAGIHQTSYELLRNFI